MNNDNVIVYRSRGEQAADDFWWSEGWITATKSGDAILVGVVLIFLVIAISIFQGKHR